jgi:hypothetical protein
VVNRVHRSAAETLSAARSITGAEQLDEQGDHALAAAVLRLHAERVQQAARERRLRERFTRAHPEVAVVEVEAQAGDVHDLDGLRRIGDELAGDLAEAS